MAREENRELLQSDIKAWLKECLETRSSSAESQYEYGYPISPDDGPLEAVRKDILEAAERLNRDAAHSSEDVSGDQTMPCAKAIQRCLQELSRAGGDWASMDSRWRKLYGQGCTLQALWLSRSRLMLEKGAATAEGQGGQDCLRALRMIDTGIIAEKVDVKAGIGRRMSLRSRIASELHTFIQDTRRRSSLLSNIEVPIDEDEVSGNVDNSGHAGKRNSRHDVEEDPDQELWCTKTPQPSSPKMARSAISDRSATPSHCGSCRSAERRSYAKWCIKAGDLSQREHMIGEGTCMKHVDEEELDAEVKAKNPCLVYGVTAGWGAMEKWRDLSYLRRVAGLRTIPVEIGRYNDTNSISRMMTLNDFIEKFIISRDRAFGRSLSDSSIENELSTLRGLSENVNVDEGGDQDAGRSPSDQSSQTPTDTFGYMAQHDIFEQIPELGSDIDIPGICQRTGRGRIQKVNGWMGPSGTISPLHKDRHDNILVQIVGEKYVRLYSPDVSKELHPGKGHLMNTSTVNLECPGLPQGQGPHADAASLPFTEVVLRAGQSLYIPAGHWHYVRSISPSFSVNVWWD